MSASAAWRTIAALVRRVEVMDELGDEDEVPRLVAEVVGERVAGAMHHPAPHLLLGEDGGCRGDRGGEVEDGGAELRMLAAEGDRIGAVAAADVEHRRRALRQLHPAHHLAGGEPGQRAHAALVGDPLVAADDVVDIERLAGADEILGRVDRLPLEDTEEHRVAERLRAVGDHPFPGERRQRVARLAEAEIAGGDEEVEELFQRPGMDAEMRRRPRRAAPGPSASASKTPSRVATTTARATITAWKVSTTGVGARPAKVAIRSSSVSGMAPTRIGAPRPR